MPSPTRHGYVIRGDAAGMARPARMSSQLATSEFTTTEFAAAGVTDARLVDPLLQQVVEQAREAARLEGFEAGRAAGFEAGREEGHALLAAQQRELVERDAVERSARKERLVHLLGSVEDAVVGALDYQAPRVEELRELVAATAVDIAEAVVGHHLQMEDCAARDALTRVLSTLPRQARLSVRLHPDDVAAVADISGGVTDWSIAQVVPDPSVERGDAYAEADNLEIEASIAGAFERVRKVLNP